jgi:hypothetical protein
MSRCGLCAVGPARSPLVLRVGLPRTDKNEDCKCDSLNRWVGDALYLLMNVRFCLGSRRKLSNHFRVTAYIA